MNTKNEKNIGSEPQFLTDEAKQIYLGEQLAFVREVRDGNKTWSDFNEFRKRYGYPDVNTDSLRRSFAQLGLYDDEGWVHPSAEAECGPTMEKEVLNINYENGTTISERIIPLSDKELRDPNSLLKAHGFNPNEWIVKTANNNKTRRVTPNGDAYYYASRINVKPKTGELTFDDIDKFFEEHKNSGYQTLKIEPKQYDKDGEFLEICLQDLHMGLLSYEQETGSDYDVNIAKTRLINCISDIYERCHGRKFKRIVLVLLGDLLHIDNMEGTTTKGTRQDIDTRPTKIFDEALELLIDVINKLGEIAPVEVVNIQGNHDRLSSYMLCKGVEMAYRGDKNVKFNNGPNPRKWIRYGKVLIGYAHGDMKQNAITEWLCNECSEWSEAKYREVHLGHLHSTATLQKIEDQKYGLIARYLPALCGTSAWEHEQGYPDSQRGMMSFVWNEEKGLREVWYTNI